MVKNNAFLLNDSVLKLKPIALLLFLLHGGAAWADFCQLNSGDGDNTNNIYWPENSVYNVICGQKNIISDGVYNYGIYNSVFGQYNVARGADNAVLGAVNFIGGSEDSLALGSKNIVLGSHSLAIGGHYWGFLGDVDIKYDENGKINKLKGIDVVTTAEKQEQLSADTLLSVAGIDNLTVSEKEVFLAAVKVDANTVIGSNSNAVGSSNIVVGRNSSAFGNNNQIIVPEHGQAFGSGNTVKGYYATAMGQSNSALESHSVAVGNYNSAQSVYSNAIGTLNSATAYAANAMGAGYSHYVEAKSYSQIDVYNDSPIRSIQLITPMTEKEVEDMFNKDILPIDKLKPDNILSIDSGDVTLTQNEKLLYIDLIRGNGGAGRHAGLNIASGVASNVYGVANQASGVASNAIGTLNIASADFSNAFGYSSVATAEKATAIGYNSLADEANTVSIGRVSAEKRLTNLANASKSTDAVNLSQLYPLATALGGGASFMNGLFTAPTYTIQGSNYNNVGGTFAAVDSKLTNLQTQINNWPSSGGMDGKSAYEIAVEMGFTGTQSDWINSLGGDSPYFQIQSNSPSTESSAQAIGEDAIAIGSGAVAQGKQTIAIGVGNKVTGHNSGAIGDPNTVTGNNSYAVGNNNTVSGDNTFVVGSNVNTSAKNAVVLGNDSASNRDNTLSVGASGKERQVVHVAAGTDNTDAVNVKQMQEADATTLQQSRGYADEQSKKTVTTAKTYTDTKFAAIDQSINNYQQRVERLLNDQNKRIDRTGAMGAAMLNMATSTAGLKTRNRIGFGAGIQGSENAVSIGYQLAIDVNATVTIGGAFSGEESSGGFGFGLGW